MKITKSLIPNRDEYVRKKKDKITFSYNDNNIKKENKILKNIIQKNASLKNLKEKIQKESNNNIQDIFSSDENRIKAIKYVIKANSKGKENQKNDINIKNNIKHNTKIKKNLSFVTNEIPLPENTKNKIKVKRSQKAIYMRMDKISPIKKDTNKNRFFYDDKPLNEDIMLKDNNMLSNQKEQKFIYDSPSTLIARNKSLYDITTQREINIQYIQQPNNNYSSQKNLFINSNSNTQNNFYDNNNIYNNNTINNNHTYNNKTFYNKINYNIKKENERIRSPISDYYNKQNINASDDDNLPNKTVNSFYVHKQINRSVLYGSDHNTYNSKIRDNSMNKYNDQKVTKIIFSNINNNNNNRSYDMNNNFVEKYKHKKNISQDGSYYNDYLEQNNDKNQYYVTDANNFYEPSFNSKLHYNNFNKFGHIDNNDRKKKLIRIMNNNNNMSPDSENSSISYIYQQKLEKKVALKKKNNSFYINDSIPIKINQFNQNNDQECNNDSMKTLPSNTYNNNFTFHKKTLSTLNYKGILTSNDNNIICNDNKENISNNRILVKKRPVKDSSNSDLLNINSKINPKMKNNKLSICSNISYNCISKNKNKFVFENENEIIEYINNKFEEDKKINNDKKLKYTGFILTKKYKGKILHEIRIEDNMEKVNQKLKEEKIQINNDYIEINPINTKDELDNLKNIIINIEKEIAKLKQENQTITKKDYLKNELIKRLDKEKQNIIEENEKLNKEIEEMKKLNDNKDKELKEIISKIKIENIMKNYKIENQQLMSIKSIPPIPKLEMFDQNKLKEVKIELNSIGKNNVNSDNISLNLNGSNVDIGHDSKKSNPLSVLILSKISEIKDIKIDNIDSGDKVIKANLDLLNEKNNNDLNENKNNGEVKPFNENGE